MKFNFYNPYYVPVENDIYRKTGSDQLTMTSNKNNSDTVLSTEIKPHRIQLQLKTKKLTDALDIDFPNEMPFKYILYANMAGITYDLDKIEKYWCDYLELRFRNSSSYSANKEYLQKTIEHYKNKNAIDKNGHAVQIKK